VGEREDGAPGHANGPSLPLASWLQRTERSLTCTVSTGQHRAFTMPCTRHAYTRACTFCTLVKLHDRLYKVYTRCTTLN
jgi:hypothetical protein